MTIYPLHLLFVISEQESNFLKTGGLWEREYCTGLFPEKITWILANMYINYNSGLNFTFLAENLVVLIFVCLLVSLALVFLTFLTKMVQVHSWLCHYCLLHAHVKLLNSCLLYPRFVLF